ncbi:AAA domain (dynein-related subfamily) [Musa troglodytarum]|uniref:AAA domain (Dynein-related subfamily) n=1 Tax=Musa troglodytarum TaxID=320322 RepID=A0A9E7GAQ9_9LILI|nr:AAA domain (dynein-related subfamily) [Musa troglodytarum]
MLLLRPNPYLSSVAAQARTRGSLPPFLSFFSLRLPSRSLPAPSPLFSTPPRRPRWLPPPASGDDVVDEDDGFDEELRRLLVLLPLEMRRRAEAHPELRRLVEIVMDLGRRPLARFPSGDFFLSDCPISSQDLHHAASQVGDFTADNRAGISRTLHRISAIRNRKGSIIGLTCRVGRAVTGSANLLRDLVKDGGSLLLIGPPGVGKTTVIREIARMLADDYKKRVMIVDTSNEIGGDGDIPHAGIGSARVDQAVENHMPQVIVIDEIGTKLEAVAASTIAQRGIQLVATAHGVTIENLIMNPSLEMLVGGIQSVTLGDEEASRRGVQKTVLERKGPSTFTFGAQIVSKTEVRVHRSLEATVDALLAGRSPNFEIRKMDIEESTVETLPLQKESLGDIFTLKEEESKVENDLLTPSQKLCNNIPTIEFKEKVLDISHEVGRDFHLFVYGIMESSVLQALKQLGIDEMIETTDNVSEADAFLALSSKLKKNSQIQAVAKSRDIPIFVTKSTSLAQITKAVGALVNEHANVSKYRKAEHEATSSEMVDALEEARLAIEQIVIPQGKSVRLLPRPPHIIPVQIDLIKKYKLKWEMVGQEPGVHLRIFPLPLQAGIGGKKSVDQVVDENIELDDLRSFGGTESSQSGVPRLPLLPEW